MLGKFSATNTSFEPLTVFLSYSHKDEELRERVEKTLTLLRKDGLISVWHDRKIVPGVKRSDEINKHLETARIILLLISPDFLASSYCYDIELKTAMEKHRSGDSRVVPILLRPVEKGWKDQDFGKLVALPTDGRPVTTWSNEDSALANIAGGIREIVLNWGLDASPRTLWSLVLKGRVSKLKRKGQRELEALLRQIATDETLTVREVSSSNIRLVVESSSIGYRRIRKASQEGKLSKLIGRKVESLSELHGATVRQKVVAPSFEEGTEECSPS